MPCRFYRQVIYDEQLQACIFIDTSMLEYQLKAAHMSSFMSLQKDALCTTQILYQFKLTKAKDSDWKTR